MPPNLQQVRRDVRRSVGEGGTPPSVPGPDESISTTQPDGTAMTIPPPDVTPTGPKLKPPEVTPPPTIGGGGGLMAEDAYPGPRGGSLPNPGPGPDPTSGGREGQPLGDDIALPPGGIHPVPPDDMAGGGGGGGGGPAPGGAPPPPPPDARGADTGRMSGAEEPFTVMPEQSETFEQLMGPMREAVASQLENPSVYDSETFQRVLDKAKRGLEADLASRGFRHSTGGSEIFAENVMTPLLRERARTLESARRGAFNRARGLTGFAEGVGQRNRQELRGERRYMDELRRRARQQAMEEFQLQDQMRRQRRSNYQRLLTQALGFGSPGSAVGTLGSAAQGMGSAARQFGNRSARTGRQMNSIFRSAGTLLPLLMSSGGGGGASTAGKLSGLGMMA